MITELFKMKQIDCSILNRIKSGEDVSSEVLCGVDFSGKELNSVNLDGLNLSQCDFRNCVIVSASLVKADLTGTNFENAKLLQSDFSNCILSGASLMNADLTCANFENANLQDVNFENATFSDTNFRNANFSNARLIKVDLSLSPLEGAIFEGALMSKFEINDQDFKLAESGGAIIKFPYRHYVDSNDQEEPSYTPNY